MMLLTAPPVTENGVDSVKPDAGTQLSMDYATGRKRKAEIQPEDSDEEDTTTTTAPPVHDIYRSRQQKKSR